MNNSSVKINNTMPAFNKPAQKQASLSFGGAYGLRGTPAELEQAFSIMSNQKIDFDVMDFLNEGSRKVVAVLTEKHIESIGGAIQKLKNLPGSISNVEEILDPSKFLYFDFKIGTKSEIKKFSYDDVEIIANTATNSFGEFDEFGSRLRTVKFAKPLNIKESIEKYSP